MPSFDLSAAARAAAVARGFAPDLPPDAAAQLAEVARGAVPPADAALPPPEDLRTLPWSSIDDASTRDLDQVEVAEALPGGAIRLCIGIADVDALVPAGSPIDRHARANATSVYTGVTVFPMLPEALSTDRTSLHGGAERAVVVVALTVEPDGTVSAAAVSRALVVNRARLTYEAVGAWLDGAGPLPPGAEAPEFEAQLRLQAEASARLRTHRVERGALDFETIEARPVVRDGVVTGLAVTPKSRARTLIEDFMVAANEAMARLLEEAGVASIRRVVRAPERWARIVALAARYGATLPEAPDAPALAGFLAARRAAEPARYGELSLAVVKLLGPGAYVVECPGDQRPNHFGLAAQDYTHGTAPNRRYADLVTQRLLKHLIARRAGAAARDAATPIAPAGEAPDREAPYHEPELAAIAAHCTAREDDARAVERAVRKMAASELLSARVGERFAAVVTGAARKGTFVRVLDPPVEGRVVAGDGRMDVGDRVTVRLVGTDPARGFVDFAGAEG